GPRKFEVTKDPNRKGAYASIQAAVRDAEIDSVIELWDETYEENVIIEQRADRRTGFTIQAAPGREGVWRSAKNDPTEPILRLTRARHFNVNGKGIPSDGALDKKRQVRDLVQITSKCPGLDIEAAKFKNFERSALFIINAAGMEDRPIKLNRLVTET